jgi:zinc transport system substrate-binding protein
VPHRRVALLPLIFTLAVTSCADDPGSERTGDARPVIAAAFYPLAAIVEAVGGEAVQVETIVPAGEEAHEFEPTPGQISGLEQVEVVFHLAGFQPAVDEVIDVLGAPAVDLLAGLPLQEVGDDVDPHVWLDPQLLAEMTRRVAEVLAEELAEELPAEAAGFATRAAALVDRLDALDAEMTDGLAACAGQLLVTTHEAFGYLARAYGLEQVAIAGISPGDEPSAKTLTELAELVRDRGVTTVFAEEGLPADLARTLAAEAGAASATLHTIESPAADQLAGGDDYFSLMRANLAALQAALGC